MRHQPTLDYVDRRIAGGLNEREIAPSVTFTRKIYANLPPG